MRGLFAIIHPFRPKGWSVRFPARGRRACRDRIPRLGLRCEKALETYSQETQQEDTAVRAVSPLPLYLLKVFLSTSRDASEEVFISPRQIRLQTMGEMGGDQDDQWA